MANEAGSHVMSSHMCQGVDMFHVAYLYNWQSILPDLCKVALKTQYLNALPVILEMSVIMQLRHI